MPAYKRSFATVASIVSDAAVEMGLAQAAVANPFTETNVLYLQLLTNLTSLGQDLVQEFDWSQLIKEGRFTTDGEFGENDLPEDFSRFVEDTANDRLTAWPASPVTPQEWQAIKARTVAGPIQLQVRLQGILFKSLPVTALADVYYEYITSYWVQTDDSTGVTDADTPGSFDDRVWFDKRLMVCGLKARYLRDRGMPQMVAAQQDYEDALARAKDSDGLARPIRLAGSSGRPRWNAPPSDGTWGT